MKAYAFQINEASYCWPGRKSPAIDALSYSLVQGEHLALLGSNGAGKSTLLRLLNGLLLPQEGSVTIGEMLVSRKTLHEIRRRVGVVFQNPDDQLVAPTVYDEIAFGPRNLGLKGQALKERVDEACDTLSIPEAWRDCPPATLSMGEKRRVCVAGVLAMRPEMVILDEPFTFLDARGRRELSELLQGLSLTRVLITHDLKAASALTSQALVLNQGKHAWSGSMSDLIDGSETLAQLGIG